jgi:hypothetical protein
MIARDPLNDMCGIIAVTDFFLFNSKLTGRDTVSSKQRRVVDVSGAEWIIPLAIGAMPLGRTCCKKK